MTTRTNRIEEIFQDARVLQADALEMLAQGRIRNAAEKAWGATRRATDALIDAEDQEARRVRLLARYFTRQGHLHGRRFYHGRCDPIEETERRIRETADYIEDAERLA